MLLVLDAAMIDRASVHYADESLRARLMKDLIEFWVNDIWLAELLIKRPQRALAVALVSSRAK